MSSGAIAGIVAGVVGAALLAVAAVAFIILKKRNRVRLDSRDPTMDERYEDPLDPQASRSSDTRNEDPPDSGDATSYARDGDLLELGDPRTSIRNRVHLDPIDSRMHGHVPS